MTIERGALTVNMVPVLNPAQQETVAVLLVLQTRDLKVLGRRLGVSVAAAQARLYSLEKVFGISRDLLPDERWEELRDAIAKFNSAHSDPGLATKNEVNVEEEPIEPLLTPPSEILPPSAPASSTPTLPPSQDVGAVATAVCILPEPATIVGVEIVTSGEEDFDKRTMMLLRDGYRLEGVVTHYFTGNKTVVKHHLFVRRQPETE